MALYPLAGVLGEREPPGRVRLAALASPFERVGVLERAGGFLVLLAVLVAVDDDVAGAAAPIALEDSGVPGLLELRAESYTQKLWMGLKKKAAYLPG